MTTLVNAFWKNCGTDSILETLCGIAKEWDNDFNGTNGKEFVSNDALSHGFNSDMEYICSEIRRQEYEMNEHLSVDEIVNRFFSAMFSDSTWYHSWCYEILNHPHFGIIGISVAWDC